MVAALNAEADTLFRMFDSLRRRQFVGLVRDFLSSEFGLTEAYAAGALLGAGVPVAGVPNGEPSLRDAVGWDLGTVVDLFQRATWPTAGALAAARDKYGQRVRDGAGYTSALQATRVPGADLTDNELDSALSACLVLTSHIAACHAVRAAARPGQAVPYRCPTTSLSPKWDCVPLRLHKGPGVRSALAGAVALGAAASAGAGSAGGAGGAGGDGDQQSAARWSQLLSRGRGMVTAALKLDSTAPKALPLSALFNPNCRKVAKLLGRYGEPLGVTVTTGSVSFQFTRLREAPALPVTEEGAGSGKTAKAKDGSAPPRPLAYVDLKFATVREGRPWRRVAHWNSPELCRDGVQFRAGLPGMYHGDAVLGWAADAPFVCLDPGRLLLFASKDKHVSARVRCLT